MYHWLHKKDHDRDIVGGVVVVGCFGGGGDDDDPTM